jgi:outer membrane protein assembly factor BamB
MTRPHLPDRLTPRAPIPGPTRASLRPQHDALLAHLFGPGTHHAELPPLSDLVSAVRSLAEGSARKVLLPLSSSTGEVALVRRGDQVLLSFYDSGPVPQIFLRDRPTPLSALLSHCSAAAQELSELTAPGPTQLAAQRLAERAASTRVTPDRSQALLPVQRRGGALTVPRDESPLAFGFALQLVHAEGSSETATRADVHALLFDGELWAFGHGRRIVLARGAVFPAVARMVNAARGVVDAWESQRACALRLRAGDFGIGLRLDRDANVAMTLTSAASDGVTLASLDVPSAVLPILRLASDVVRTVISHDRSQSRNLRLVALRDEVRALRRVVRARNQRVSFTNRDPDKLRASAVPHAPRETALAPATDAARPAGRLRLSLRWRAEVDGLDAAATFLCGDRLVVATPRCQLALSRDDGELIWIRHHNVATSFMAGTSLLCVTQDGEVSLSDVTDGEPYARTRIAPRIGGALHGLLLGGRNAPPVAVLTEGRDRLVAIDVRTGEPRWRFRSRGRGNFRLTRAGRILLVACGDSTLDAIDVATGDVAWRWSDPGRIVLAPAVTRDMALAVSGNPGSERGALLGLDLYSGQLAFRRHLESGPLATPVANDHHVVVSTIEGGCVRLSAFDLTNGEQRFSVPDPGLGEGGAPLVVDRHLVINTPGGHVSAIDLSSGEQRWAHHMADPVRDDVPRRLEPVLRGGALFVPSASVHVVRPADGEIIGGPISDGIIPDFLRVDERGWLYLAEESGHIEAYAPAPSLRLVKS